jgi:asparagine synthase (glutamine-hydrolysing)
VESNDTKGAWWPQLHSFSVGLEGSPDLSAAKKVADHIGTIHHEIVFTIQEGLDAINDVIYNLETYDITTIRASTPMYLMARSIKSLGIKMVLSGEGADELFGGYLYFHKAPNAKEFHDETFRKLNKLHQYDCLRANKSLAAWGIEGRVPFLDKEFIELYLSIDPNLRIPREFNNRKTEKFLLRKAFVGYLPEKVLWRPKEAFSDGVSSIEKSWFSIIQEQAEEKFTDEEFLLKSSEIKHCRPTSKESLMYREYDHYQYILILNLHSIHLLSFLIQY